MSLVSLAPAARPGSAQHVKESPAHREVTSARSVLRPGDMVRLQIWREPDLSGEFRIDETGVVIFPKIGPFDVVGESTESLKEKLLASYRTYLRNPSIEVVFLRRINVLGFVREPGLYPVDPTAMTIADAIALAGGAAPGGDPDRIELIRNGQRLTRRLSQGMRIDETIQSGDQLYVPERSWPSRNVGLVATGISALTSLVIAVILKN